MEALGGTMGSSDSWRSRWRGEEPERTVVAAQAGEEEDVRAALGVLLVAECGFAIGTGG